jgi:hypothetical protein
MTAARSPEAALAELQGRVREVLAGADRPLPLLAEACAVVRSCDPGARATGEWLASRDRSDLRSLTAGLVAALLVPERPWLDRMYRAQGNQALLPGPQAAARWIADLHAANRKACRDLLTAWLIRWRLAAGAAAAEDAVDIVAAMSPGGPVRPVLGILAGAAAPSVGPERSEWLRRLAEASDPEVLVRAFCGLWEQDADPVRAVWPVLRSRTLAALRRSGGDPGWRLGTLLRISHLDRELLTGSGPEGVSGKGRETVDLQAPAGTD